MKKRKMWVERRLSEELHKQLLVEGYKGTFDLAGLIDGCQGMCYRFKQEKTIEDGNRWVAGTRVQITDLSNAMVMHIEPIGKWVDVLGIDDVLDNAVARFWLKLNAMGRIK